MARVGYAIRRRRLRFGYVRARVVRVEGRRETELKRARLFIGRTTDAQERHRLALWGLPIIRTDQVRRGVLKVKREER